MKSFRDIKNFHKKNSPCSFRRHKSGPNQISCKKRYFKELYNEWMEKLFLEWVNLETIVSIVRPSIFVKYISFSKCEVNLADLE